MSRLILLGVDNEKRKFYFEKAVHEAGLDYEFYDWNNLSLLEKKEDLNRCIVKIDAPKWDSCKLGELSRLTDWYSKQLCALAELPVGAFFNHPVDILALLDKRRCKQKLSENNIAVTKMFLEEFSDSEELLCFMQKNRLAQIFIKPLTGSGAAGVTALRFSPHKNKIVLYCCTDIIDGELVNVKKLVRLEDRAAVSFLDKLLKLDCIIEQWYAKSDVQGYCYDLRVIVQEHKIDYILPRLSKSPITNLHLNNFSIDFSALHIKAPVLEELKDLCMRAAACYPRLNSIGMDVLIEKGSEKSYIVEMNGQGDLLHKDVYNINSIYRHQVEMIKKMM